MSYVHLRDRQHYELIYDRITVESGRRNLESFKAFREKWFETMPDEKPDSIRSSFHLSLIYMAMVGCDLVDRYDGREEDVLRMMERDEAKDLQLSSARLNEEPVCEHCNGSGLRIVSKDLMHRGNNRRYDNPEEVLFILYCPNCNKRSAYWQDGTLWEHRKVHCPKCSADTSEKSSHKGKVITTTYICVNCEHTFDEKLDLTVKKKGQDPDFERDRKDFCLTDPEELRKYRDGKHQLEGLAQLGRELKEKEDNKHIYDAIANLKKPKIAELITILTPVIEKAGYIEFGLDKPEMGREVTVGFSCLDSKLNREDHESKKTLKKTVNKAIEDTNWRLMSDGISYRLGYLNGRLRAYEGDDAIKALVIKGQKQ